VRGGNNVVKDVKNRKALVVLSDGRD
jgi:hypothetical protein